MEIKVLTPYITPLLDALKEHPDGTRLTVVIRRQRERRSIDQNRLYWMWLKCLSDETGHTDEELHGFFKQQFLGGHYHRVLGKRVIMAATTTQLTTVAFTEYLDRINAFAAGELGITLPQPNSGDWWDFYERYR